MELKRELNNKRPFKSFIFDTVYCDNTYASTHYITESPHDKTNQMVCAPIEDSDQPGHLSCLSNLCCAPSG